MLSLAHRLIIGGAAESFKGASQSRYLAVDSRHLRNFGVYDDGTDRHRGQHYRKSVADLFP
jgi:hypothetical protein